MAEKYNLRDRRKEDVDYTQFASGTEDEEYTLSDESDSECNLFDSSPPTKRRRLRKSFEIDIDKESSENEFWSDEETGYFSLDHSPLADLLTKHIMIEFSNLSREKLWGVVQDALGKAGNDLVEDYCEAIPKDQRWKTSLDEKDIGKLEPFLNKIRKEMQNEFPTMQKILQANIPIGDKKRAVRLYDILQNSEPYTQDYYALSEDINSILLLDHLNAEEVAKIENEEKKILQNLGNNQNLKMRILQLKTSPSIKTRIYEMYLDMMKYPPNSSEHTTLKQKVMWAVSLPYDKMELPEIGTLPHQISQYCDNIYKKLDEKLHGMKEVKERIIQIVNNRIHNPNTRSIIAFKGKPGVGKTAIPKALAESLGVPFEKISLGGMHDSSIFKGTDNSWVGSSPSILLHILKKMQVSNGIVLFDELDKICAGDIGGQNIQHALLDITDPTQNSNFQDLFLSEFPHDLSNMWFMFAMNDDQYINHALRDRLDIVEIKPYTSDEITSIVQLHLLPNALKDVGMSVDSCTISNEACIHIQKFLQCEIGENGLRPIEREIRRIVSRINMLRIQSHSKSLIKLSYHLPNFDGISYHITPDSPIFSWLLK